MGTHHLLGDDDVPPSEGSWLVDPALGVEDVIAGYRAECDRSRAITAELSLDAVSVGPPQRFLGDVTLRYVLAHMVDETARHLGHLDVLRELTDGRVGDG